MKKRSLILAGLIALALRMTARADTQEYNATLINDPTLAYSTAPALDVSRLESLAMQAVYSSATVPTIASDDGRVSTGTFTVLSTQSLSGLRLALGSCVIDAGGAFTPVSTTSGTAQAIADAFNLTPCLTGVASVHRGSGTSAVVFATATVIGTAGNSIAMFSNSSSVTVSGATLANGDDSSFSVANDDVTTTTAHGISTGCPLLFATVTGTAPTGLTTGTTYFAIVTSPVKFKLASSSANALAGTAVNITALTGGGTFTFTPTAFAGTWSFKWQASNDNANWFDISSYPTVTYSTPNNSMWDGPINVHYLRLNFTAGTGGGMNMKVYGFGKRRSDL